MKDSHKVNKQDNYSDKLNGYLSLLELSYSEAVRFLLSKYGPATKDYFSEKSYERFLRKEIKSMSQRKASRTQEGLYCHHIDENKFENISSLKSIRHFKYPFTYHKKERLVYCDLFEHLILHTLIAKATYGELGLNGYEMYIEPMAYDWYINNVEPDPEWMKICKEKSFLNQKEAKLLLKITEQIIEKTYIRQKDKTYSLIDLPKRLNLNMTINEYKDFQSRRKNMIKELETNYYKFKREKQSIIQQIQKNLIVITDNCFYKKYPLFKKYRITINESRQSIINYLFTFKYIDIVNSKKELKTLKKDTLKYELFNELHFTLKNKSQKIVSTNKNNLSSYNDSG